MFKPDQPAGPRLYLRVAVERGLDDSSSGAEGLTYWTPDLDIGIGRRVMVPLGKNDKPAGGVVIATGGGELLDGLAAHRVKAILRATDIRLPPRLAELARWLASYYICPLGMVLSTMLPAAVKQQTGRRSALFVSFPDAVPPIASSRSGPSDPSSPGSAGEGRVRASRSPTPPPPTLPTKRQSLLLDKIRALDSSLFPLEISTLADRLLLSSKKPLLRLIDAHLLHAQERSHTSAGAIPRFRSDATPTADLPLTPDQSRLVSGISASPDQFAVHLIRGITGSGKTEVYIRLIQHVIAQGRTAIVLVPEIALTPQTSERFRARFAGAGVAVLHSGLTAAQRNREWSRAAEGSARVIVGARSAVFAPLERLGLIVVDEEHDTSYKQDQLPRYHARDVAIKRGQLEDCPVVLGSATPSLESWANAAGPGARFHLWELPHRIGQARLPHVEIVDLMAERRALRQRSAAAAAADPARAARRVTYPGLIGPTLMHALDRTLAVGGQAILLLNRRGYSSYLCCSDQSCGWVLTCDQCDAALVLHMDAAVPRGKVVKCHHCLAEQLVPDRCPTCTKPIIWLGGGTQRLEEELIHALGPAHGLAEGTTLRRVDSDSMRTARDYFDTLERFGAGQIRVLVGTQMIAKGLDYPNVRLVGVVNADTALSLPDFRAAERTFQLIAQVAGRAGRGEHPGRVIIQSVQPDHPVITLAAQHDYVTFATEELALRRHAHLPPVTRMARIVVRDKKPDRAQARAGELAAFFQAHGPRSAQAAGAARLTVRGPMPCPITRIAGYFRYAVELTAPAAGPLQQLLTAARNAGLAKSDAATAIDVDPVAMM